MTDENLPYITNPKTLRDVNQNVLLLIQKVNHEQTNMNKDIQATNKKVRAMEQDVTWIKTNFKSSMDKISGMSLMLKIFLGIVSVISALIGIGAIVS